MTNASIDFKVGWPMTRKYLLVRPQRQKIFKCAQAVQIRKQLILTAGVQLAFQRMKNQRARSFPETVIFIRDEEGRDEGVKLGLCHTSLLAKLGPESR